MQFVRQKIHLDVIDIQEIPVGDPIVDLWVKRPGPLDCREQRALFVNVDTILTSSGLEEEFIRIALADHGINSASMSTKRIARFARMSVLALRANIARKLTGFARREFCARLADSRETSACA
jgi:hypothetical protein